MQRRAKDVLRLRKERRAAVQSFDFDRAELLSQQLSILSAR
jgi:hypothetical protein